MSSTQSSRSSSDSGATRSTPQGGARAKPKAKSTPSESAHSQASSLASSIAASDKTASVKSASVASHGGSEFDPLLGSSMASGASGVKRPKRGLMSAGTGASQSMMASSVMASSAMASSMASSMGGSAMDGYDDELQVKKAARARCAERCKLAAGVTAAACLVSFVGYLAYLHRAVFIAWWNKTFPPSCVFSQWSSWGPCTATCDTGVNIARRRSLVDICRPIPTKNELVARRPCELQVCNFASCRVGDWADWGDCSQTCDEGVQTRRRQIVTAPSGGGAPCPSLVQLAACTTRPCSSTCGVAPWEEWSPCSQTCGMGTMARFRLELPNAPAEQCPSLREEVPCFAQSCDVPCHFNVAPRIHACLGMEHCNGTASRTSCAMACQEGLVPDGHNFCMDGLLFLGACVVSRCNDMPPIANSLNLYACRQYSSGSRCRVACEPGYRSSGDAECLPSGSWSATTCDASRCGSPATSISDNRLAVARADLSACRGATPREVCTLLRCRSGYVLSTPLICDGTNFNHPRCDEAPCEEPPPSVPDAAQASTGAGACPLPMPSRSVCSLSCAAGFAPSGWHVCVRGEWVLAQCYRASRRLGDTGDMLVDGCAGRDAPRVEGAERTPSCEDAKTGDYCPIACKQGLEKSGDLLCAGGRWMAPLCAPPRCLVPPPVQHGADLSSCAGAADGDECLVLCEQGYEPSVSSVQCLSGRWGNATCDEISCPGPPVPPRATGDYKSCAGLLPGDVCPLVCEPGFEPHPPEGFHCLHGGHFTRADCRPSGCLWEPSILRSNGLLDCMRAPSGTICFVFCYPGFIKSGDALCHHGRWYGGSCQLSHTCGIQDSTAQVPFVENALPGALRGCMDTEPGQSCPEFRCLPGYEPTVGLERALQSPSNGTHAPEFACSSLGNFDYSFRCAPSYCRRPPPFVANSMPATLLPGEELEDRPGPCFGLSVRPWVASGARCPLRCERGYSKTLDHFCMHGEFVATSCERLTPSMARTREVVTAEIRLPGEWQGGLLVPDEATTRRSLVAALNVSSLRLSNIKAEFWDTDQALLITFDVSPVGTSPGELGGRDAVDRADLGRLEFFGSVDADLGQPQAVVIDTTVGRFCSEPPRVEHATTDFVTCNPTISGRECPLSCSPGYSSVGRLLCFDGNWTHARCGEQGCDAVPVVNNAEDLSHCLGAASGSRCSFLCAAGFRPMGSLWCTRGTWGQAQCMPLPCTEPPIVEGGNPRRHDHCAGLASGEHCRLRCEPGYEPTDDGTLECAKGNWRRLGECRPAHCRNGPVVENALSDLEVCAGAPHGTTCSLVCRPGFSPVRELRCVFGWWTVARCQPSHCTSPPIVSGLDALALATCVPAPSGSICPVTCGYGRKLSELLECNGGEWTTPTCVPAWQTLPGCDHAPIIPRAQSLAICIGLGAGEACPVACDPGYAIDTPPRCIGATWTPATCKPLGCADLPVMDHSGIDLHHCQGYEHTATCRLFCELGYMPLADPLVSTSDSLLCDRGAWWGPRCGEAPCDSPPPSSAVGRVLDICLGTPSGESCKVACEVGYVAAASPLCVRGVWEVADPVLCKEAPCTEPPEVPHAVETVSCVDRPSRSICLLTCEPGYHLEGVVECTRGLWHGGACVPKAPAQKGATY